MYQKVSIQKLSPTQIGKLLRGHRIRVKQGSGMAVNLSREQAKKVASAGRKGRGCCIQFDPYQQEMHKGGEGFLDTALSVGKTVGKAVAPVLIDVGASALKDYVGGKGDVRRPARAPASRASASASRVSRRGRGSGEGFLDTALSVGKTVGKAVAPVLVDVGATALKDYVAGKGKGKKGGALMPAGGALMPAGYSHGGAMSSPYGYNPLTALPDTLKKKGKGKIGQAIGSTLGEVFLPF